MSSARHKASLGPFVIALAATGLLATAAVLFLFEPSHVGFFPPCAFHAVTGLWCPGCGSTRALHHLLHGRIGAALGLNALLVLSLPLVAYLLIGHRFRSQRSPAAKALWRHPMFAFTIAGIVSLFWVFRNLPFAPFHWLAP